MLAALALALLASPAPGEAERPPDEVRLKDGRTLAGYVVYEDETRVILLEGTRERVIPAEQVDGVRSAVRALAEVLDALDRIEPRDAAGLVALARTCRERGLPGEADVLLWQALAADGGNDAAHELLGHQKRGGRWTVRSDGRSYELDDLVRLRGDWGNAWELRTTHYALRTNTSLDAAVGVALDLERIRRAVYAFLGRELELRDPVRPMQARVHADSASFPESLGDRRSYFDAQEEALIVHAARGIDPVTLVHEAVHQLLWASGAGQRAGRAEVPGWLDEGLAVYLAAGARGEPGKLSVAPGGTVPDMFREHAGAKKPFDLSRVLAFGSDDFAASSDLSLKYAQSYTLVHFLLHGDGEKHRPGFFDFLRGCWNGKSSMTDFKRAIGVREADLERAWSAYAAQHR